MKQAREGEERGAGTPRTEAERRQRHEELYPGTPLPSRGTGISQNDPTPILPALFTLAFMGGLGFLLSRKR